MTTPYEKNFDLFSVTGNELKSCSLFFLIISYS